MTRDLAPAEAGAAAVGLDPALTGAWLRAYHGALARRLVHEAGRLGSVDAGAGGVDGVRWLHPRAVWAARVAVDRPDLVGALDGPAVGAMLAQGRGAAPPLEHIGADRDEPWSRWGVDRLAVQVNQFGPQAPLRLAAVPLGTRQANVDQALALLADLWPEAATEFHLQVRAVVHVDGGWSESATADELFGAIFLGERHDDSVAAAFEMAVHESAHLALVLRNRFQPFVTNGTEMARHPLRPDLRPISGAVHAAYALARMATGLARWRDERDAPAEVALRADVALENLLGTMGVLRERAAWTHAGRAWFTRLEQHAEVLVG